MEGPVSFVSIQLELCVGEKEAWVGEGHLTGGSKGFGSFFGIALAE